MLRSDLLLMGLLTCLLIAGCESGTPATDEPAKESSSTTKPEETSTDVDLGKPDNSLAKVTPQPIPNVPAETPESLPTLPKLPDPYAVPFENPINPTEAQDGWISLFDGHSLMGWNRNADGANWSVKNGVITADDGPIDLLCTSIPFADFELDIDFRMEADGNSGVFLRTLARPEEVTRDCYEVNIADSHPDGFTTGAIVGREKTAEPVIGSGGWKTFHIICEGPQVTVYLDGDLLMQHVDETDGFKPSGLIGLQKNAGKVEFRNIRLKPLGMESLFNGKDLTGWRVVPGHKSEFTVSDGEIQVKNGLGFLESEQTWADFIFQAEAQTHAEGLNSGYFFRALRIADGENCNGYESQISNAIIDGDRKNPKDHGTGAIFRRAKARYVVPSDGDWFTTTLITSGPRICVWVDGYQVVDFLDTRPANENPRRGTRIEAGHISIQGHDPTTDLSFRNLRIDDLESSE